MKIVFFEVPKKDESIFLGHFNGAEVSFCEEKLEEDSVKKAKDADVVSVFVNSKINKKVINALPNLKFIATRSTGFDHIDCEYAKTKGIKVANVSSYGSHTVAEFTFGLMLNLSRRIIFENNYVKKTEDFNYFPKMEGFDLNGKTLGVVGTGKIGKNVVKIAKGFGMNIVAYDLYPDLDFARENNFEYKSLEDAIKISDVITLHTPYNKENHHLINKNNISLMKKGVCLVNTARGELIDTFALVEGLKSGIILGFATDVLEAERILKEKRGFFGGPSKEEERLIKINHELMEMPNVIITPHVAFFTFEAVASIQKTTIENIEGFLSGALINLVN